MPQDLQFHTDAGWILVAAAGIVALVALVIFLRQQAGWSLRLAVAGMALVLTALCVSQLRWIPNVPNGISMGRAFFDATPISPDEPVECLSVDRLRSNGIWPLGKFVGRVESVSGTPGSYEAELTSGGGGFPVHDVTEPDGFRDLVLVRSSDCYVEYTFDGIYGPKPTPSGP